MSFLSIATGIITAFAVNIVMFEMWNLSLAARWSTSSVLVILVMLIITKLSGEKS